MRKSYPVLKAYIEWDLRNRDSDNSGLVEWYIEENENCRSGESSMDNSARYGSLISNGLKRYGFNEKADKLIEQTMAELEKMYLKYGTFLSFTTTAAKLIRRNCLAKGKMYLILFTRHFMISARRQRFI